MTLSKTTKAVLAGGLLALIHIGSFEPARANGLGEDVLKFGIHSSSHGTYLRRIQMEKEKIKAEFELKRDLVRRDLLQEAQASKKASFEKRIAELEPSLARCEARAQSLLRVYDQMSSHLQVCGTWMNQLENRLLRLEDLESQVQMQVDFQGDFADLLRARETICEKNDSPDCERLQAVEPYIAALTDLAASLKNIRQALPAKTIREVCLRLSSDTSELQSWQEQSQLLCDRLRLQKDNLVEKVKGL